MFRQASEWADWHSLEIASLFNLFRILEHCLPLSLFSHYTLWLKVEIIIIVVLRQV